MDSRYATVALTPCTSRNCSASAPGTTPAFHDSPPSVVTVNLPPRPAAQTTRGLTGLIAISPLLVPLDCGVNVGCRFFAGSAAKLRVAKATATVRKTTDERFDMSIPPFRDPPRAQPDFPPGTPPLPR